jgi:hypothetical protein
MSYPLIFAYNGDQFARVNYDGSWSVNWNKTRFVASETQTATPKNNMAIVACATALMAAKDNFYLTPWEESDKWKDKWEGKSYPIDFDTEVNEVHLQMKFNGDVILQVNGDGTWSVKWEEVKEAYAENSNKKTASLCQMLLAARYNFIVSPWPSDEEEDEDDGY